jgi:hypothetical protein
MKTNAKYYFMEAYDVANNIVKGADVMESAPASMRA